MRQASCFIICLHLSERQKTGEIRKYGSQFHIPVLPLDRSGPPGIRKSIRKWPPWEDMISVVDILWEVLPNFSMRNPLAKKHGLPRISAGRRGLTGRNPERRKTFMIGVPSPHQWFCWKYVQRAVSFRFDHANFPEPFHGENRSISVVHLGLNVNNIYPLINCHASLRIK